ncbi:MAG TPA: ribose-5-phosphate isomerase RpiA [Longimicrobiales bacterium]|nr:ribose-5-phosphate isomerase RpiA [Longimicrobiales bacterium]
MKQEPGADDDPAMPSKRAAARLAAGLVESGMKLGLGTGSTAALFLEELARRLLTGEIAGVRGVPTSRRTAEHATRLGIPLATLDELPDLDLVVDGADEVDPHLDLIKGLGGALLWEKIVAQAGRRMVVVADCSKLVERLGARSPVPVEVVRFGIGAQHAFLRDLGATTSLRSGPDGEAFLTDGGHNIIDARFPGGVDDPPALERILSRRAGIVESGLFLGMAGLAIVGEGNSARVIERRGGAA